MLNAEEALHHCMERGLTFVAFRWHGQVHLWVQDQPALERLSPNELDARSERFIVAPFHDPAGQLLALRPSRRIVLDDTVFHPDVLKECIGSGTPTKSLGPSWDQAAHQMAIADAKRCFADGSMSKVVLARGIERPFPRTLVPQLFNEALGAYPVAFVCMLNCPELGTWLGASPERLVGCEEGIVTVDAIAGTLRAEVAPGDANGWGDKERDEQELVSQAVEKVFAEASMEPVERSGPTVMQAGPVAHLRTTFKAGLSEASLATLVGALHPTPAVCGTPREAALAFIARYEPTERMAYAGFWGPWQVQGRTELYVNIRCLQAFADTVGVYVGGGITAGSDARNEWLETEHKARTWTRLMEAVTGRIS